MQISAVARIGAARHDPQAQQPHRMIDPQAAGMTQAGPQRGDEGRKAALRRGHAAKTSSDPNSGHWRCTGPAARRSRGRPEYPSGWSRRDCLPRSCRRQDRRSGRSACRHLWPRAARRRTNDRQSIAESNESQSHAHSWPRIPQPRHRSDRATAAANRSSSRAKDCCAASAPAAPRSGRDPRGACRRTFEIAQNPRRAASVGGKIGRGKILKQAAKYRELGARRLPASRSVRAAPTPSHCEATPACSAAFATRSAPNTIRGSA